MQAAGQIRIHFRHADCALPVENWGESVSAAPWCPPGCCSRMPWSPLPRSAEEGEQQQPIGRAWLCPPCCPQPPLTSCLISLGGEDAF